jgi:DNA replication protein DnaC
MSLDRFISEAFDRPPAAIAYEVSRRLAELFPERAVVEGSDCDFDLMEYVREGLCTVRRRGDVHGQVAVFWSDERGIRDQPRNVWYEVNWRGERLEVLIMDWADAPTHYWIVAEAEATARRFFEAVCRFDPEPTDEVLVFDGGRFESSPGLFRALEDGGYDDLVLPGTLKQEIRADLERFFAARATYERLGAPWKRGILFTGPPGNGKTHTIKALVRALGRPCLYVKSFKAERLTEETNIRRIFTRARQLAPCVLVLEDLDALVTNQNRSFLLNELDGFARNTGVVTLATTNHPERLDPALVDRPSRFDRTYTFPLPGPSERRRYIERWNATLAEGEGLTESAVALVAETTDGFSFAYLKELFLAAVLARAASGGETSLDDALLDQVAALRTQRAGSRVARSGRR